MSNYSEYISGHKYPPGTVIAVSMNQKPTIKEKIKNYFKRFKKEQKVMSNTKFKVGDSVIVKEGLRGYNYYDSLFYAPEMVKYQGRKAKIADINCYGNYKLDIWGSWSWNDEMLEPDNTPSFTKADLKDGMVVEYKNGGRRIVLNRCFMNPNGYGCLEYSDFNDDLTLACVTIHKGYDIVKVYSSISTDIREYCYDSNITLIWERKEEPDYKEMTVAEIEKKLGYKVKIVDGE